VENANNDADDVVVDNNALKFFVEDANATDVDDIDDGNSGDDGSEVELLDKGVDFGYLQS
jgi:hypothetical protein